ncbi:MAG: patatin-like phospholipase family protein [Silicimonas sp.]|nr:patatin-like phospholipase family protein [Silicimonas sp.]
MAGPRRINLALQGGGAHGAFTWGVVDRLLQEDSLEIAAISGTSAGALNGAAIKSGMVQDGRQGARDNLEWLWGQVTGLQDLRMADWMRAFCAAPGLINKSIENSIPYAMGEAWTRVFSPYTYGPFYQNPLKRITDAFAFEAVCADSDPKFFVSTTAVRTGKVRVFSGAEITSEVLMASACLPTIFQAVEIDGEAYWDGGYTGNPALFPLFAPELPSDIVIVNINPLEREETPRDARDILNRINEISFNSSLLRELRAIHFVQRLIGEGRIPEGAMKAVRVHMIADDDLMTDLGVASKLVPTPSTVGALFEAGQGAAERFLGAHGPAIGKRSSLDLPEMYG